VKYSLLNSLDTTKKKTTYVEYVLHIGEDNHSFIIEESLADDFEKQFSESDIKTLGEFNEKFGNIITKK
jgi:hypothetical protein